MANVNHWINNHKRMRLDYSYTNIDPVYFPGHLPFADMYDKRVKVTIRGSQVGGGPSFNPIGTLLCHHRADTNESGITLLLDYQMGTTPPSNQAPRVRVRDEPWERKPSSAIRGQILVPLTREAIDQIRKVSDSDYQYELTLADVQFDHKTAS